jgi:murein DD-endopeptidase MepM/ murein hydrolase activator NlpD
VFYNRQNKSKKYNIIIIPERGSSTKKINLSSTLIKSILGGLFIVGLSTTACVYIFFNRYNLLSHDARTLKTKNEYIKTLELDNKDKDKQIKSYKVYQATINSKMKQLDELEQTIKNKLDKSDFLSDSEALTDMAAEHMAPIVMQMSYSEGGQTSIQTIENQIESLTKINKQLDQVLEKEKYIPSVVPCKGTITSYFGIRSNPFDYSGEESHSAIDIANDYGTKIHATAKGTVICSAYKTGYGNCIFINHGNGLVSIYGHASELLVEEGEVVEKGSTIALMGSTGRSTGSHVHFELRKNDIPINPIRLFE